MSRPESSRRGLGGCNNKNGSYFAYETMRDVKRLTLIMTQRSLYLFRTLTFLSLVVVSTGCDESNQKSEERPVSDFGVVSDLGIPEIVDQGGLTPDVEVSTRLNSIFPNRASVDGNVSVRLVGDEFVDGISVRLGTAGCQQVEVLSGNHLRCIVPAAEIPGRVDVRVTWPDGTEETLVDGFSYFVPL